jgi:hypothetical protein
MLVHHLVTTDPEVHCHVTNFAGAIVRRGRNVVRTAVIGEFAGLNQSDAIPYRRRRQLRGHCATPLGGEDHGRLRLVSPDEASAVWNSIPNPSARRVAKILTQAGRGVPSTIARWRAQGWRAVVHGRHPIEVARESLEVAIRALTSDPAFRAEAVERKVETSEKELSHRELLERSTREVLVMQIVLGPCPSACSKQVPRLRLPRDTGGALDKSLWPREFASAMSVNPREV